MLTTMADWLAGDPPPFEATFDFEWTDAWDMAIAAFFEGKFPKDHKV